MRNCNAMAVWTLVILQMPMAWTFNCATYTGSICKEYLDYTNVALPDEKTVSDVEADLTTKGVPVFKAFGGINPTCVNAYLPLICMENYPQCEQGEPVMPCRSLCYNVVDKCTALLTSVGQTKNIPKCTQNSTTWFNMPYPDEKDLKAVCNAYPFQAFRPGSPTTTASLQTATKSTRATPTGTLLPIVSCPLPLIPDPVPNRKVDDNIAKSIGSCFFTCPNLDVFYTPGLLDQFLVVSRVVNWFAIFGMTFLSVSFTIVPSKRSASTAVLRFVFYSTTLLSYKEFFLLGGVRELQCVDEISKAVQSNSPLCTAQGVLIMFSAFGIISWYMWLGLNMLLRIVFKLEYLEKRHWIMHAGSWPVAIVFCAAALGVSGFEHQSMGTCLLTEAYMDILFFFPLTALLVISFGCFLTTSGYILWAMKAPLRHTPSIQSATYEKRKKLHAKMTKFWRLQWRTLVWLAIMFTCFFSAFVMYYIQLRGLATKSKTAEWTTDWAGCVFNPLNGNNTQQVCAEKHSMPNLPSPSAILYLEFLTFLGPLLTAVIFIPSNDLFSGWCELVLGPKHPLTMRIKHFNLLSRVGIQQQKSKSNTSTSGINLNKRSLSSVNQASLLTNETAPTMHTLSPSNNKEPEAMAPVM